MWKFWNGSKGEKRAVDGRDPRCDDLERRLQLVEAKLNDVDRKLDSVVELPVQWATTTTQLRRLVGHITKSQALDNRPAPVQNPPVPPRALSQDDVVSELNRGIA